MWQLSQKENTILTLIILRDIIKLGQYAEHESKDEWYDVPNEPSNAVGTARSLPLGLTAAYRQHGGHCFIFRLRSGWYRTSCISANLFLRSNGPVNIRAALKTTDRTRPLIPLNVVTLRLTDMMRKYIRNLLARLE